MDFLYDDAMTSLAAQMEGEVAREWLVPDAARRPVDHKGRVPEEQGEAAANTENAEPETGVVEQENGNGNGDVEQDDEQDEVPLWNGGDEEGNDDDRRPSKRRRTGDNRSSTNSGDFLANMQSLARPPAGEQRPRIRVEVNNYIRVYSDGEEEEEEQEGAGLSRPLAKAADSLGADHEAKVEGVCV